MASDTSPRVGSHPPENTSDTSERPRDAASQVRRGPGARPTALPAAVAGVFADYEDKVARPGGPLRADSVRVYRSRVRQYWWLCRVLYWEVLEMASTNSPTLSSGSFAARSAWLMMPTSSSFSSTGKRRILCSAI
jgi:hypothetical protein